MILVLALREDVDWAAYKMEYIMISGIKTID